MGIIYKLTSPNGKGYIGQSTKTFETRLCRHKSAAADLEKTDGCRALNNAIRAHGWDNFSKEVLLICPDDDLDRYEARFIAGYGTLAPGGYNLITGGNSNKVYSATTKEKMRRAALARDSSAYRTNEASKDFPKH